MFSLAPLAWCAPNRPKAGNGPNSSEGRRRGNAAGEKGHWLLRWNFYRVKFHSAHHIPLTNRPYGLLVVVFFLQFWVSSFDGLGKVRVGKSPGSSFNVDSQFIMMAIALLAQLSVRWKDEIDEDGSLNNCAPACPSRAERGGERRITFKVQVAAAAVESHPRRVDRV